MTQLSPPVTRAVAVLNFLAGHAEQAFTLTEIAKSLRMSSATCHNLLAALSEAGYVYRTAGKTYILGPALARVAKASLSPGLAMLVARPEMRLLADEFDVVCSASYLDGDLVRIYERASAVSHLNWNTPHLFNVPAAAPIGGIFLAYQNDAIDGWLAAADPPILEEDRSRLLESLQFTRINNYTFGVRKAPLLDRERARELQNQQAFTDYAMCGIDPGETYQLAYVAAPVFSQPGVVAFGLSLAGFIAPAKGSAIVAMAGRLRAACDRIGAFIAGRKLR